MESHKQTFIHESSVGKVKEHAMGSSPSAPHAHIDPRRAGRQIVLTAIEIYQSVSAETSQRLCRFNPTCSSYARLAIEEHGVFRGGFRAWKRFRDCRPLVGATAREKGSR